MWIWKSAYSRCIMLKDKWISICGKPSSTQAYFNLVPPLNSKILCIFWISAFARNFANSNNRSIALPPLTWKKMVSILMKEKINEFLATGNDITVPILSLVKDASSAFPPIQLAATGALFIVTNVKVLSSIHPKCQSMYLLTVHIRASRRARKSGKSSATMS